MRVYRQRAEGRGQRAESRMAAPSSVFRLLSSERGYTLIELVAVMAITAVVLVVVAAGFSGSSRSARYVTAAEEVKQAIRGVQVEVGSGRGFEGSSSDKQLCMTKLSLYDSYYVTERFQAANCSAQISWQDPARSDLPSGVSFSSFSASWPSDQSGGEGHPLYFVAPGAFSSGGMAFPLLSGYTQYDCGALSTIQNCFTPQSANRGLVSSEISREGEAVKISFDAKDLTLKSCNKNDAGC